MATFEGVFVQPELNRCLGGFLAADPAGLALQCLAFRADPKSLMAQALVAVGVAKRMFTRTGDEHRGPYRAWRDFSCSPYKCLTQTHAEAVRKGAKKWELWSSTSATCLNSGKDACRVI